MPLTYKNVMFSLVLAFGFNCAFDCLEARESRGLDDFTTFTKTTSKAEKACSAISYSKAFDDWCNFYLNGQEKKADQAWAKVLAMAKNVETTKPLMRRAIPRLLFADIPKNSPLKKVEIRHVFKQWLRVAKAELGPNHRFVGDAYASMANYYEGQRVYRNASMYRKRQFEVYKQCYGATNRNAIRALYYQAKDSLLAGDFEQSEQALKQSIKLSEKAKYRTGTRESVKLYLTLLQRTKRLDQAKRLTDKYKI